VSLLDRGRDDEGERARRSEGCVCEDLHGMVVGKEDEVDMGEEEKSTGDEKHERSRKDHAHTTKLALPCTSSSCYAKTTYF
jgi:hypothetical protein